MRKHLLSIAALALIASAAAAQALMSPSSRILLDDYAQEAASMRLNGADSRDDNGGTVDLIITLNDGATIADIADGDAVELLRTIGRMHIVRAKASALEALTESPAVATISVSTEMGTTNDVARTIGNVDAVHAGTALTQAFTGKNVLVGIIDRGIDYNHINFKDADGRTRIRKIWQYNADGTITTAETPEQIAAMTCDITAGTHGSHTLGTAAGSCTTTPIGDFHGMAPDANLLVCSGSANTSSGILRSVADMADEAERLGMPLVINISLGNNRGPHDGSDAFSIAMDEMAQYVPVVISAGNEGCILIDKIVVKKTFTASDTQARTALIRFQKNLMGAVEIYSCDGTTFNVDLDLYDTSTKKIVHSIKAADLKPNTQTLVANKKNGLDTYLQAASSTIKYAAGIDPNNGRYLVSYTVNFPNMKKTTLVPVITVTGGTPGKRIDMYCSPTNDNMSFGSVSALSSIGAFDEPTSDGTINALCTGYNTIAVGAYTTRDNSGGWYSTKGEMAAFSSWGTLIDGRDLPHISAPGCWLISSMSRYCNDGTQAYTTTVADGQSYPWTDMAGTSMSAPFVTGSIATWLQANPTLTPGQIRDIAMETASKPATFDGSVKWGAGLLDCYAGIKKAIAAGVSDISADSPSQAMMVQQTAPGIYEVTMAGQSRLTLTAYTPAGAAVASAAAEGPTAVIDMTGLASGIYILRAEGPAGSAAAKCSVR